jgi:hypothetical protein
MILHCNTSKVKNEKWSEALNSFQHFHFLQSHLFFKVPKKKERMKSEGKNKKRRKMEEER